MFSMFTKNLNFSKCKKSLNVNIKDGQIIQRPGKRAKVRFETMLKDGEGEGWPTEKLG